MKRKFLFNRGLALLLVFVMCLSLFVGCNGDKDNTEDDSQDASSNVDSDSTDEDSTDDSESSKISEDLMTVSMFYIDNANYPYKEDWLVLEKMTELTNVKFDMQVVPSSDYRDSRTVAINSGTMPEILAMTFQDDVNAYIDSGVFLPISDYVDKMPNYQAFIEKYDMQEELDNTKEADGKYYVLPTYNNPARFNNHSWLARVDLLEDLGYDDLSNLTLDDVYEACKAYKAENPDSYPMTSRFGGDNILQVLAPGFNTLAGWGLGNMFKYDADADEYYFACVTDEYKELLTWLHKMYDEELLDPEYASLDSTTYEARAIRGDGQLFMIDWIGNEVRYNKDGATESGNPDFDVEPIMPPKGPDGYWACQSAGHSEQSWAINAEVTEREDFDEFLAFVDWMYTDEAAELFSFGIEGTSFEVLDDGRKEYIDVEFDNCKEYGTMNNSICARKDPDIYYSNKTDYVINLLEEMDEKQVFGKQDPKLRLTEEQKETEGLYKTNLIDYVKVELDRFVYGEESLDNWDSYVEQCNTLGAQELYDLYNEAWDAQN